MSLNYLTLGPVPCNESCAQVGVTPDYDTVAQGILAKHINNG